MPLLKNAVVNNEVFICTSDRLILNSGVNENKTDMMVIESCLMSFKNATFNVNVTLLEQYAIIQCVLDALLIMLMISENRWTSRDGMYE